jgi:hypothetical protein
MVLTSEASLNTLHFEFNVDKATNGFVVYDGKGVTTIHPTIDAVVADLQKRCSSIVADWVVKIVETRS